MRYLSILSLFLLARCTSIGPKSCEALGWEAKGYAYGYEGISHDFEFDADLGNDPYAFYVKQCAHWDVKPRPELWEAGLARGLAERCVVAGGFDHGYQRPDDSLAKRCPSDKQAGYLQGFAMSRPLYPAYRKKQSLASEINALQNQVDARGPDGKYLVGAADRLKISVEIAKLRSEQASLEAQFAVGLAKLKPKP